MLLPLQLMGAAELFVLLLVVVLNLGILGAIVAGVWYLVNRLESGPSEQRVEELETRVDELEAELEE